jgi:hypothetical protein
MLAEEDSVWICYRAMFIEGVEDLANAVLYLRAECTCY